MPLIVKRTFCQQSSASHEPPSHKALSEYFGNAAIIVLGDPGAGKTTSFKQAAEQEPSSLYTSVRDFLELRIDRYRGKTLYLDALDEMRGHSVDGISVLGEIRGKLDELDSPSFRLSCRAVDWYGSSDSDALSAVSADGTVTVLEIDPLSEAEICEIVGAREIHPAGFIAEARARGIDELLQNPQTLNMLLDVVGQGEWPVTRVELFQKAADILVREHNDMHRKGKERAFENKALLQAAGYMSAVMLCGGFIGIACDEDAADSAYYSIYELDGDSRLHTEVLHRRLFHSQGNDRVTPVHRTIAEFLAAIYFNETVKSNKLPIKRALALITGQDGGTLSDLRGVYAWLSCLCLDHAESLIERDPLGVVLYGDASLLSTPLKCFALNCLEQATNNNPWLRADHWTAKPLGGLCSPEMELYFRAILSDNSQHPVAVSFVIDAIRHGQSLPGLGDLLLDIARDSSRASFIRKDALKTFLQICGNRTDDLINMLDEIHADIIHDFNCELRAYLLNYLYPQHIGCDHIIKYLVEEPKSFFGKYWEFLSYRLLPATSTENIPVLLDVITAVKPVKDRISRHSWCGFLGKLLLAGLSLHGKDIAPDRLYCWLGIVLDRHGLSILDDKAAGVIREWLTSHPEVTRSLYDHWLSITPPEKIVTASYRLWERLLRINFPEDFDQWLRERAIAEINVDVAQFLYRESLRALFHKHDFDNELVVKMYQFVEDNPRFQETLQREMFCEITDWRIEHAQHEIERKQEKEATQQQNINYVLEHKELVHAGRHAGALTFLAQIYFGMFSDVDRNLDPYARIESITNAECAEAAFEGFVAALQLQEDKPTVEMICDAHSRERQYNYGFVVLAGLELLFSRSPKELTSLTDDVLGSAIAYHYAFRSGEERDCINHLLVERPGLSADVLECFWKAALAKKREHISGLYSFAKDVKFSKVAEKVSIRLLNAFPNCKTHDLEYLLYAAISHSKHDELLNVAVDILSRPNYIKGDQRLLWLATAYLLRPVEYDQRINDYCSGNRERTARLFSFVFPTPSDDGLPQSPGIDISMYATIIELGGKVFDPDRFFDTGDYNTHSQSVRGIINRLGAKESSDANVALRHLMTLRSLEKWREALANALDIQIRKRREALFKYPSLQEVVKTLSGCQPANSADLQALVMDHLLQLKNDIGNGNTDGYKAFWNVDSHCKVLTPRPEEICRDHLLDRLKERLRPMGIDAAPEGHFARDKRADIKVTFNSSMNLPIEIKRHYHAELWSAPVEQLKKLYSRDPDAAGRGIYLVFWFGTNRERRIPKPPTGIVKPSTPEQLEKALIQLIPETDRALIEAIVIDCSGG